MNHTDGNWTAYITLTSDIPYEQDVVLGQNSNIYMHSNLKFWSLHNISTGDSITFQRASTQTYSYYVIYGIK